MLFVGSGFAINIYRALAAAPVDLAGQTLEPLRARETLGHADPWFRVVVHSPRAPLSTSPSPMWERYVSLLAKAPGISIIVIGMAFIGIAALGATLREPIITMDQGFGEALHDPYER